jgi:hypothetical protein
MEPYWSNERHGLSIYCVDCMDWLGTARENSVDMLATDPPYGISFMGKEWDRALPDPAIWRECMRVLKPGGAACVMSGARLDCLWRVCRDLEEGQAGDGLNERTDWSMMQLTEPRPTSTQTTEQAHQVAQILTRRPVSVDGCPECGGQLIRQGGCMECPACGWSACS